VLEHLCRLAIQPVSQFIDGLHRSESGAAFIFKNRIRHFHFRCFART
jgi:hypothetical protein